MADGNAEIWSCTPFHELEERQLALEAEIAGPGEEGVTGVAAALDRAYGDAALTWRRRTQYVADQTA